VILKAGTVTVPNFEMPAVAVQPHLTPLGLVRNANETENISCPV
jgi:hypothetical protein